MDTFGATFQPNSGNDDPMRRERQGDPVQQAIQILALRLPKFLGARGVSPSDILSQGGGQGLAGFAGGAGGEGALAQQVMQALMGAQQQAGAGPQQAPQPAPMPGTGKPRIHSQQLPAPNPTPSAPTSGGAPGAPEGYRPNVGGYGQGSYPSYGGYRPNSY
jgi:hypothetical protein